MSSSTICPTSINLKYTVLFYSSNYKFNTLVIAAQEALSRELECRQERKKEMVLRREGDFYTEQDLAEVCKLSRPPKLNPPLPL